MMRRSDQILKFIDSIVGILGAVGDQYYWNSIKPFFIMIPLFTIMLQLSTIWIILATTISFLFYNYLQLSERVRGLKRQREHGFHVVEDPQRARRVTDPRLHEAD